MSRIGSRFCLLADSCRKNARTLIGENYRYHYATISKINFMVT
jgi:hypothetical protein